MKIVMSSIAAAAMLALAPAPGVQAAGMGKPDSCLLESGGFYDQHARSWMVPQRNVSELYACRQKEHPGPAYAENPLPAGARPPDQCLVEAGGYYDQKSRSWRLPMRNTPALFACRQRRRQGG